MTTIDAIIEQLKRQDADGKIYIRRGSDGMPSDEPSEFLIDGNVDLIALAAAIDFARNTGVRTRGD